MKISVVIPVYGQWDLVDRNVNSLLKYDPFLIEEIILVDDCSREKNVYTWPSNLVRIIKNEKNSGYTKTVNKGLKEAKQELILLLDSDAFLVEPIANKLLDVFLGSISLGCLGLANVNDFGSKVGSFQYEPSLIGFLLGQHIEKFYDKMPFRKKANILPYSCSVVFRKKCLEEMNYFDETNFPVLEADHDLSMRIHRSKWKLMYCKDIVVVHLGGYSYKVNNKRLKMFYEGRMKLLYKHGKITNPTFVKNILIFRLSIEKIIMRILGVFKRISYLEKIKGRNEIIKIIRQMNFY